MNIPETIVTKHVNGAKGEIILTRNDVLFATADSFFMTYSENLVSGNV
jgi:hypothetical protein